MGKTGKNLGQTLILGEDETVRHKSKKSEAIYGVIMEEIGEGISTMQFILSLRPLASLLYGCLNDAEVTTSKFLTPRYQGV